jgi:hypothetical protein
VCIGGDCGTHGADLSSSEEEDRLRWLGDSICAWVGWYCVSCGKTVGKCNGTSVCDLPEGVRNRYLLPGTALHDSNEI